MLRVQYFDLSAGDGDLAFQVQPGSQKYHIGVGKGAVGVAAEYKHIDSAKVETKQGEQIGPVRGLVDLVTPTTTKAELSTDVVSSISHEMDRHSPIGDNDEFAGSSTSDHCRGCAADAFAARSGIHVNIVDQSRGHAAGAFAHRSGARHRHGHAAGTLAAQSGCGTHGRGVGLSMRQRLGQHHVDKVAFLLGFADLEGVLKDLKEKANRLAAKYS